MTQNFRYFYRASANYRHRFMNNRSCFSRCKNVIVSNSPNSGITMNKSMLTSLEDDQVVASGSFHRFAASDSLRSHQTTGAGRTCKWSRPTPTGVEVPQNCLGQDMSSVNVSSGQKATRSFVATLCKGKTRPGNPSKKSAAPALACPFRQISAKTTSPSMPLKVTTPTLQPLRSDQGMSSSSVSRQGRSRLVQHQGPDITYSLMAAGGFGPKGYSASAPNLTCLGEGGRHLLLVQPKAQDGIEESVATVTASSLSTTSSRWRSRPFHRTKSEVSGDLGGADLALPFDCCPVGSPPDTAGGNYPKSSSYLLQHRQVVVKGKPRSRSLCEVSRHSKHGGRGKSAANSFSSDATTDRGLIQAAPTTTSYFPSSRPSKVTLVVAARKSAQASSASKDVSACVQTPKGSLWRLRGKSTATSAEVLAGPSNKGSSRKGDKDSITVSAEAFGPTHMRMVRTCPNINGKALLTSTGQPARDNQMVRNDSLLQP